MEARVRTSSALQKPSVAVLDTDTPQNTWLIWNPSTGALGVLGIDTHPQNSLLIWKPRTGDLGIDTDTPPELTAHLEAQN